MQDRRDGKTENRAPPERFSVSLLLRFGNLENGTTENLKNENEKTEKRFAEISKRWFSILHLRMKVSCN